MVQMPWKTKEEQVRGIAQLIFGATCEPDRIAGVNFDGIIRLGDSETIAIEISKQHDLDKVRQGIGRLNLARIALAAEGVLLRGYIVLSKPPTPAMSEAAKAAKFHVMSPGQFAALFFHFPRYKEARLGNSFGSSIDPQSGEIDRVNYVPVSYTKVEGGKDIHVSELGEMLLAGQNIVLLGEYGAGKSRCIRELFSVLSKDWDKQFKFPFAVNLRDCWGLTRADEVIRRSIYSIGLDDVAPQAVQAFNNGKLLLLLDGFDELGSQSWSTDEVRLRQLRALALRGVKDLINKSPTGNLIAGREHYFSSNDEMMAALGLTKSRTVLIKAKDEFNDSEMEIYFDTAGLSIELPSWLPKRPLICQTIALLSPEELDEMFGTTSGEASFWNHFMRIICQRDARINSFFDSDTIFNVFVALSRITRKLPSNVGPISQRDLQDAFEAVVGQLPVEDASVMLQRLPSLGRIGAESSDRQFVDFFILDGLRAKDVSTLVERDEAHKQVVLSDKWVNPLGLLGHTVLAADIASRLDKFLQIAHRACNARNSTLAADIVSAATHLDDSVVDMHDLHVEDGFFSELRLNRTPLINLTISSSTFERLVLPNSPPANVKIKDSLASKVSGASSYNGLPAWIHLEMVDEFDSVETVSEIRKAGLTAAHEILVVILKKVYTQRGGGRKEEALLRGFGAGASKKLASSIINLLLRTSVLDRHKGDEGWVYTRNSNLTTRILKILSELRSSSDPVWVEVGALNRDT